ncbi:hypothetical protein Glove_21g40 [Diversispora epigaea]|uniref:Uncharacterized protein n=1 Tax=Diversispora epigaea TaxID=1348612 RepID=A0A397JWP9_9GLOM|nr:hypothetical protein Glove_21g40 [Diversispora epigaea]
MYKTCFVGGLLVEAEKICNAYFVGGKARNRAEKNNVFVGYCLEIILTKTVLKRNSNHFKKNASVVRFVRHDYSDENRK